ncbi:hypothetical protein E5Q_04512 [Mixia osmundae IAM 14324]|uniref:SnoaL-like domain-containing protein n=1 Tax=Mixia osmundae (strain CBS 9802 / IAM 14324 / JCM 22182 / KY 12970) TaxID=764103 RepID=G7E4S3_MIXOS|nr:hypothetical protein E5Q_04512 [Mixia osmundae IAM 14324]
MSIALLVSSISCHRSRSLLPALSLGLATMSTAASSASTDHGIPLEGKRLQLVQDAMALFGSKPSPEIFKRSWTEGAIFEDPIAYCKGSAEYYPQWLGMPKAFPISETLEWKVVTNEPNLIEYTQKQKYTLPIKATKVMDSLVRMELDSSEKITHFEDRWGGKPCPTNKIAMFLRRANARTVPKLIGVPIEYKQVFSAGSTHAKKDEL